MDSTTRHEPQPAASSEPVGTRRDTLAEFRAGALAILPAAVAVVPFGLLLGARAVEKGLSPLETMLMSALVFAGSSQFVAVELWRDPVPWGVILASTLLINSRHVLMGASLTPKMRGFGTPRSLLGLFFLADEVWALAERRAAERGLGPAFHFGLALTLYANWIFWTGLGAFIGALVRNPAAYGFDFAFTAIFIGLLAALWRGPSSGAAIAVSMLVSAGVSLVAAGPWSILAGGLAGTAAGALWSLRAAKTREAAS